MCWKFALNVSPQTIFNSPSTLGPQSESLLHCEETPFLIKFLVPFNSPEEIFVCFCGFQRLWFFAVFSQGACLRFSAVCFAFPSRSICFLRHFSWFFFHGFLREIKRFTVLMKIRVFTRNFYCSHFALFFTTFNHSVLSTEVSFWFFLQVFLRLAWCFFCRKCTAWNKRVSLVESNPYREGWWNAHSDNLCVHPEFDHMRDSFFAPKASIWSPAKLSIILAINTFPMEINVRMSLSLVPRPLLPDAVDQGTLTSPAHTHSVAWFTDSTAVRYRSTFLYRTLDCRFFLHKLN